MQATQTPALWTIGVIARRYGVAPHRVEYVIRTRGIAPESRAGNARVFRDEDVLVIASELSRINGERESARV